MNLYDQILNNPIYIRLLLAVVFMLFFLIFSKLLLRLILYILSKPKFNTYSIDYNLSDALKKPLHYTFIITGIYAALCISPFVKHITVYEISVWFINSNISLSFISFDYLTKFYTLLLIILVTWGIYNSEYVYEEIFTHLNARLALTDNTLFIRFSAKIIRFFTVIIGITVVLSLFITNITGVLTGVGLGSVAFAFITKDTFTNILSGSLLMIDKPFIIGDWIQVLDIEGIVEDISFRSTRIRTFTRGLVIIPNSKMSSESITNWSKMEKRRVRFELLLAYHTPPSKIHTCIDKINQLLAGHDAIDQDTYIVRLDQLGAYSLHIQIVYFTFAIEYPNFLKVKEQINLKVLDLCASEGLEIALPTQTIMMRSVDTET